jgi:hypothetical protein
VHYVHVLPNITTPPIMTFAGPAPRTLKFAEVVVDTWLSHPEQFGQGITALRSGIKLEALFRGAEVGTWVPVEDADYERLKKAVEQATYNPAVSRYLLPFAEAILNAPTEKPVTAEAPPVAQA